MAEHTVVSPEELVIVRIFVVVIFVVFDVVIFVVNVHIVGIVEAVLVHCELNVHQGILNAHMIQDFLKNTAVVGVVRVDDGAYRYCVIERVTPVVDAESAEDVEAELGGVEVYLGCQIRRDCAYAPPLVVNVDIESFDSFLKIYTVHREELRAVCGQVNRHCSDIAY